jgi:hypothetical protein
VAAAGVVVAVEDLVGVGLADAAAVVDDGDRGGSQ